MRTAAIVPSYRVATSIVDVVRSALEVVDDVYVVDDKCPENSGRLVEQANLGPRVKVLFHADNGGVGAAVMTGYRAALADGVEIMVKVDGDGQMDPELIPDLIYPIIAGKCDYVKGNRFFNVDDLEQMPALRLFGNAVLSFVSKASSGYWDVMDPTNGFTAIHRSALEALPLDKIAKRYFFESDMLFRLYLAEAVVRDFPMRAKYGDEVSNLNIRRVAIEFPGLYLKNFFKRFFYTYLMRDFNVGSIETMIGSLALFFGIFYGIWHWVAAVHTGEPTPLGTIMLAALPIILGTQLLLAALSFDVNRVPRVPLWTIKRPGKAKPAAGVPALQGGPAGSQPHTTEAGEPAGISRG